MTLDIEWTTHHLTPRGWVVGDKQRKFRTLLQSPPPTDRLLSVVNKVTQQEFHSDELTQQEVWRSPDSPKLAAAIAKFGPAPLNL